MEIKHTHPEYATSETRQQALLDTKRRCITAFLAQKQHPDSAHKSGTYS